MHPFSLGIKSNLPTPKSPWPAVSELIHVKGYAITASGPVYFIEHKNPRRVCPRTVMHRKVFAENQYRHANIPIPLSSQM